MRSRPARWLGVATILMAAPVLWGSSALAQPAEPTGSTGVVTFTGSCADRSGAGARVTADPAAVTVPAGTQLQFVNQIGMRATLLLDGEPAVELPVGAAAAVTFHEGPVAARMEISCPRGELAATVMIEVATGAAEPEQTPLPPTPDNTPGDLHTPEWTPPISPGTGTAADPEAAVPAGGTGSGGGPNGLLALIATVCVAGVSAAAIRAILAQRSPRAEAA
jgi:hypothetical protein